MTSRLGMVCLAALLATVSLPACAGSNEAEDDGSIGAGGGPEPDDDGEPAQGGRAGTAGAGGYRPGGAGGMPGSGGNGGQSGGASGSSGGGGAGRGGGAAAGAGGLAGGGSGPGGQGVGGATVTPCTTAGQLFCQGFDKDPVGWYTFAMVKAGWNNPPWENGVARGRTAIVELGSPGAGRALRVAFPKGGVGPNDGGAQWLMALPSRENELFVSYRVRFGDGFDFVRGGKLPGLAGGNATTGGTKPTGSDGWSARMMWRPGGKVVQYVYHADQPANYGVDVNWSLGGQRSFVAGRWHTVEHQIVMNTPGQANGVIRGWFDGQLALEVTNLRFRTTESLGIDKFYFSTFFGGNDATWAPSKDETIEFDDFVISKTRVNSR